MATEQDVAANYHHGNLEAAVLAALVAAGKESEHLTAADMMGADEFHSGGAQATADLAAQLGLTPAMHLLDIGSGLGGPARHIAREYGCRVTGIDLSAEYVAIATSLSRRMGMGDKVDFRQASAAALEFGDASFDGATLLHVGMNIPDKAGLFAEVQRVLRPGGFLAVYDVMQIEAGVLDFPVPWSKGPETSFVATPETYRALLAGAGFTLAAERNRGQFAAEAFAALRARQAASGPPPLGLHVVMGPSMAQRAGNLAAMTARGLIAPVEMIARR